MLGRHTEAWVRRSIPPRDARPKKNPKFDDLVISRNTNNFVIPAKAGIH